MQGCLYTLPAGAQVSVDLYEMFLVAMEQGGFPRVNKNNKWGYLSKQLGILPKDKPASHQDLEQVKRFYVRWIRQFEGERVSPELKKQLLPSAAEGGGGSSARRSGFVTAPLALTASAVSAASSAGAAAGGTLLLQPQSGLASVPHQRMQMQMQQQHHLLPQYEQLQQQLGKEGSSQDFSSGGAQLRAERKAALQQQSAAADLIKLIWRRERLSAKYTAEAVAARMARRQRRQALLATGQLAPATDVSRLTQSLADRRYAPGDFVFALNCLYYLSKPLRGLSIEQHPALLYEVSLLLEEAAAACRESLLSLHVPQAAQAATSAVEETEGADDLSDVEWADQDEEQEHASEAGGGALTRQGRVFRRPEAPMETSPRPSVTARLGGSSSSSFPDCWGGPLKEHKLQQEGMTLKAAAAALLSAIDCVAVAALRAERVTRAAAARAAAASARAAAASAVPSAAPAAAGEAASEEDAVAAAKAFVQQSAAELLEGLIEEKHARLREEAALSSSSLKELNEYDTRCELRRLLQLQKMLGVSPSALFLQQQQQQQAEEEESLFSKKKRGAASAAGAGGAGTGVANAAAAAAALQKRRRLEEEEGAAVARNWNEAAAAEAGEKNIPTDADDARALLKRKQPLMSQRYCAAPPSLPSPGVAVAAAVLQQQLQAPPSCVAVLLADATDFVVVHMQRQQQQQGLLPLAIPADASAAAADRLHAGAKRQISSSDGSAAAATAEDAAAAANTKATEYSVQLLAETLQQAVQSATRPMQLLLMRRAAAVFAACSLHADTSKKQLYILLRLLQQLSPLFDSAVEPLAAATGRQIVAEEEAAAAAAAAAAGVLAGQKAVAAAALTADARRQQQQQLLQQLLFLDLSTEAEALAPFLVTATNAAKAFSAFVSLLPPSSSVCPAPPRAFIGCEEQQQQHQQQEQQQAQQQQQRKKHEKPQEEQQEQPEESWIGLAAAASLARLLRGLQAEAEVRLPRCLLSAKGLQFLQAVFETTAQLLLFRQSVLTPHMDVFLSVAAAILQMEVELPRLKLPKPLLRDSTQEAQDNAAEEEKLHAEVPKAATAEAAAKLFLSALLRYIRHNMMEAARLSAQEELAEAIEHESDEEGEGVSDTTAVAVGCIGALATNSQLLPLLRPHLPLLTEGREAAATASYVNAAAQKESAAEGVALTRGSHLTHLRLPLDRHQQHSQQKQQRPCNLKGEAEAAVSLARQNALARSVELNLASLSQCASRQARRSIDVNERATSASFLLRCTGSTRHAPPQRSFDAGTSRGACTTTRILQNACAKEEEEAVRGEAMAQVPWEVLSRQPVEASAALKQLRLCYRSIRKAAAAAEGAATAQGVLQQEILGSLKTAHAALSEVLLAEAKEPAAEASLRRNACFEAVRIRQLCGGLGWGRKVFVCFKTCAWLDLHSNDGTLLLSVETTALVFTPKVGDLISEFGLIVRSASPEAPPALLALCDTESCGRRVQKTLVALQECKAYVHHKDKSRRIEDKAFVRIHIIEVPKSHSGDRVAIRGSVLARGSGPLAPASVAAALKEEAAEAGDGAAEELSGRGSTQRRSLATAVTAGEDAAPRMASSGLRNLTRWGSPILQEEGRESVACGQTKVTLPISTVVYCWGCALPVETELLFSQEGFTPPTQRPSVQIRPQAQSVVRFLIGCSREDKKQTPRLFSTERHLHSPRVASFFLPVYALSGGGKGVTTQEAAHDRPRPRVHRAPQNDRIMLTAPQYTNPEESPT
ncbi:arid bright DNA-binding domain-containing protein [Cyclospora cayetanensis]|uniref:Arid bright DNA-binding domain-containing protein n=1 Tax=Cyclospora cayetanensis TaxID=88456 RepID=A0A1D3D2L0_9EIME|nr:arid bright DNA-binding domain-containing protein [Cyclospora cayetanensis]